MMTASQSTCRLDTLQAQGTLHLVCKGQPKLDFASHWTERPFPVQGSCEQLHGGLVLPFSISILAKCVFPISLCLLCLSLCGLLQCKRML